MDQTTRRPALAQRPAPDRRPWSRAERRPRGRCHASPLRAAGWVAAALPATPTIRIHLSNCSHGTSTIPPRFAEYRPEMGGPILTGAINLPSTGPRFGASTLCARTPPLSSSVLGDQLALVVVGVDCCVSFRLIRTMDRQGCAASSECFLKSFDLK